MAIGSLGVGSGLDLESLVTKLIQSEGQPRLANLARREAKAQAGISAFGSLKSGLDKFRSAAKSLDDASSIGRPAINTGGSALFSASGASGAALGRYSVQVLDKASAQKLASSADFSGGTSLVGAGTLTISVGGDSFSVTADASTTLQGLRDAINNSAANTGVGASLIVVAKDPLDALAGTVTRLVLTATDTGTDNKIETSVSDADLTDTDNLGLSRFYFSSADPAGSQLDETQAAKNARIAIDGFTAISSSNTFEDVIEGVSLTVLKEPADPLSPPVEALTVSRDVSTARGKLEAFVAAYNDLAKTIKDLTAYDKTTGKAATLNGDSTVRNISSQIRNVIGSSGATSASPGSLGDLGISLQADGTLKIDSTKLGTILNSQLPGVTGLLTGESGLGKRLDNLLGSFVERDGLLDTRSQGFDRQIKSISKERDTVLSRMEALDADYRKRFAALDALVARTKSSGDYLLAQLESTSKIITGS
jgi:flagellar hook-associated protein 2